MDTMNKPEWLKRKWPLLAIRWAVFSLIIGSIAFFGGENLTSAALLGLAFGGLLNVAWCWVA